MKTRKMILTMNKKNDISNTLLCATKVSTQHNMFEKARQNAKLKNAYKNLFGWQVPQEYQEAWDNITKKSK